MIATPLWLAGTWFSSARTQATIAREIQIAPTRQAVIHFLKSGGKRALITDPENLPRALEGRAGTHFIGQL